MSANRVVVDLDDLATFFEEHASPLTVVLQPGEEEARLLNDFEGRLAATRQRNENLEIGLRLMRAWLDADPNERISEARLRAKLEVALSASKPTSLLSDRFRARPAGDSASGDVPAKAQKRRG